MKKFDLNRFGKVTGRLILVRRRSLSNTFLGFAITFFIIVMLDSQPFNWTALSHDDMAWRIAGAQGLIKAICLVAFFVIATMVIKDLSTRQARISEMMLPATNLEKFLSRILLVTLVFPAAILAALLAADCAQQLLNMLIHHGGRASLIGMMPGFFLTGMGPSPLWAKLEGMLLFNAFAVLGGMLFRKSAWLKTLAAMTLIGILAVAGITLAAYLIQANTDYVVYLPDSPRYILLTNIICGAIILLAYWGAYRLYTRMQVINNRWINI